MNRIAHLLAPTVETTEKPAAEPPVTFIVWGVGGANGPLREPILAAIEGGDGLSLDPYDTEDWCVCLSMPSSVFHNARARSSCVARWTRAQ
jgi:hypothetical protein